MFYMLKWHQHGCTLQNAAAATVSTQRTMLLHASNMKHSTPQDIAAIIKPHCTMHLHAFA
jgi:hypothetical protein